MNAWPMPVKQRMKPSVTILDVERGQWGHCVTADIPIYRGGARTHTIETERPTRMVCGLITQSSNPSRATNKIKLLACLQGPLRWAFLFLAQIWPIRGPLLAHVFLRILFQTIGYWPPWITHRRWPRSAVDVIGGDDTKTSPTSNMSSQRVVYAGDLRSCRIAQLARSPCSCTSALASFTVPRPYR